MRRCGLFNFSRPAPVRSHHRPSQPEWTSPAVDAAPADDGQLSYSIGDGALASPTSLCSPGRMLVDGQWTGVGPRPVRLDVKHGRARKSGWAEALERIARSELTPEEAPQYVETYIAAVELQARTRGMLARTRARNLIADKKVQERALINTGVLGAACF